MNIQNKLYTTSTYINMNITALVESILYTWVGFRSQNENNTQHFDFDGVILENDEKLNIVKITNINYDNIIYADSNNLQNIKITIDNITNKNILIAFDYDTVDDGLFIKVSDLKKSLNIIKNSDITYVNYNIDKDASWDTITNNYYDIIWAFDCDGFQKIADKTISIGRSMYYPEIFNDIFELLSYGYDKIKNNGMIVIPYISGPDVEEIEKLKNKYKNIIDILIEGIAKENKTKTPEIRKIGWTITHIEYDKFPYFIYKNNADKGDYLIILQKN